MDALNYAAWVLKPTNDGVELNNQASQNSLPTAMSVDSDTVPVDASAEGAERISSNKGEAAFEREVERTPLLFIDDDNEGDEGDVDAGKVIPPDSVVNVKPNADGPTSIEKKEDKRQQQTKPEMINIPLLDYLCALNACSLKELQLLLYNVQARKHMITYLQQHCALRTAHLRPAERNHWLQCHDFSTQSVNHTYACNGYLELTVRQYFFAKHGLKLKYPYLPCLIEFGGGSHASYYPLEVINVVMEHTPLLQLSTTTDCSSTQLAEPSTRARRSTLSTFGIFEVPPQFPTMYKSKNNTVKKASTLEEHAPIQRQETEKGSNANGGNGVLVSGDEMIAPPSHPPPPMHQQKQRNGGVCCCCCCRCAMPSTSAAAAANTAFGSPTTLLRRT